MFNWVVAAIAFGLWTLATLLYLRPYIKRALAERGKRREMAAKIREQQAKGPGG
jgi:hypothetical protein